MATWLPREGYGVYAIALMIFMLAGTVHTGLITEPMLVFGSGRYRDRPVAYLRALVRGHVRFSAVAAGVLIVGGLASVALGQREMGIAVLVLALAQPFMLWLWLLRRACYVRLRPQQSAAGGVVYAAVLLPSAYVLQTRGQLSVISVLCLMAVGSLVASLWIRRGLGSSGEVDTESFDIEEARRHHRDYSSWAVATGVLSLLPSTVPYFVLPVVSGLEGAAVLKAVFNFITPASHAYAALSLLLVPVFVRATESGRLVRYVLLTGACLFLANGLYWFTVGTFSEELVAVVYRGRYSEYAGLLWFAGIYPVVSGLAVVVRTALRAREQVNLVFWASALASLSSLTIGLGLILAYGLFGAVIATVVNITIELLAMVLFFQREPPKAKVAA